MNDFVVVANRLPVDLSTSADGTHTWSPSPGGLVAALSPVLEAARGCWVGWPGIADASPEPFDTDAGVLLHPVSLSEADYEAFYEGFSNATLWPLYHDLIVTPRFESSWWEAYRDVNEKFATEVSKVAAEGATVWVQDYQLQLVPGILRQTRPDLTIGFFLHIPFPAADLFRQLPWREEVIRGILGADIIGFHLESYVANFLDLVRQVGAPGGTHTGMPEQYVVEGVPSTRRVGARISSPDGRSVGVGAYPISIDMDSLGTSDAQEVARLRAELGDPRIVMLGVDRLDYTKGILQRLTALEELLDDGALSADEVVFVQIATPSRERIKQYQETRSAVEEAVGRINGRFGTISRPVVHYFHRSLPKQQLHYYYQLADVMLVTPFKDGMNLVAKEYVACHPDGSGALVLSEFAGAAGELNQAFLCNPFDSDSTKRAILNAVRSLELDPTTTAERMSIMHAQVKAHDVNLWAQSFTTGLVAARDEA